VFALNQLAEQGSSIRSRQMSQASMILKGIFMGADSNYESTVQPELLLLTPGS
jgi:hypothetical protein